MSTKLETFNNWLKLIIDLGFKLSCPFRSPHPFQDALLADALTGRCSIFISLEHHGLLLCQDWMVTIFYLRSHIVFVISSQLSFCKFEPYRQYVSNGEQLCLNKALFVGLEGWLGTSRALAVLLEDTGSIFSTLRWLITICISSSRGFDAVLWPL